LSSLNSRGRNAAPSLITALQPTFHSYTVRSGCQHTVSMILSQSRIPETATRHSRSEKLITNLWSLEVVQFT
jgi:hypothetical protein